MESDAPEGKRRGPRTQSAFTERLVKAAIFAVIAMQLADSLRYHWHRAGRTFAGWEETVEHHRRTVNLRAYRRALRRQLSTH